jgi:hypothetical protein
LRYAKGNFDTIADLASINVRGQKDISADKLASVLRVGLDKGNCCVRKKKPSTEEIEYIRTLIDKVTQRYPKARSPSVHDLLLTLDDKMYTLGTTHGMPVITSKVVLKLVQLLRLKVDFAESETKNLIAASEEYLLDRKRECKAHSGRRLAYDDFIPSYLVGKAGKDGWAKNITRFLVESEFVQSMWQDDVLQKKVLNMWQDDVLLKVGITTFASTVSDAIANFQGSTYLWVLDELAITAATKESKSVEFSALEKYSATGGQITKKRLKFVEKLFTRRKAEMAVKYADGNFAVAVDLGKFALRGQTAPQNCVSFVKSPPPSPSVSSLLTCAKRLLLLVWLLRSSHKRCSADSANVPRKRAR